MDYIASYKVIGDDTAKCATPGTAVNLAGGTATGCHFVDVSAFPENQGAVQLGASTVLATANGKRGRTLSPGETVRMPVKDVSMLYMDALNANDGVSYVYYKVSD